MTKPSTKQQIKSISALSDSNVQHPFTLLSNPLPGKSGDPDSKLPQGLRLNTSDKDLLNDPTLVENYSDILKMKPGDFKNNSASESASQTGSDSVSGSVVITPTLGKSSMKIQPKNLDMNNNNVESPVDSPTLSLNTEKKLSTPSNHMDTHSNTHHRGNSNSSNNHHHHNNNGSDDDGTHETSSNITRNSGISTVDGYTYSDSDFEDNLEQRLRDMNGSMDSVNDWRKQVKDAENENNKNHSNNNNKVSNKEDTHDDLDKSMHANDDGNMTESEYSDIVEDDNASSVYLEFDNEDEDVVTSDAQSMKSPSKDDSHENDKLFNELDMAISQEGKSNDDDDSDDEEYLENYDEFLSDELEEDEEDYLPLPPPKELDPDKIYALYPFDGQDPSHCQLEQDEACILLNDQDSYWWLVKRLRDNKIGFTPAEILETHPERVARLNCWKNENMSHDDLESINTESNSNSEDSENVDTLNKSKNNSKKSVNFSNIINYVERYIEEDTKHEDESNDLKHHDEFTQKEVIFRSSDFGDDDLEDDISDIVSDVSFATTSMMPLNIKKTRSRISTANNEEKSSSSNQRERLISNPNKKSDKKSNEEVDIAEEEENEKVISNDENNDSDKDVEEVADSDSENIVIEENKEIEAKKKEVKVKDSNKGETLHKVFEAPHLPFSKNKISVSNSQHSLTSIGEYSPSSSECTTDSPPIRGREFPAIDSELPNSKALNDISTIFRENIKDQKVVESNIESQKDDKTIATKEVNPKDTDIDTTNDTANYSSQESSSEDFYMQTDKASSSLSTESSFPTGNNSIGKQISHQEYIPTTFIDELYNPVFTKLDDIMKSLDDIVG